MDIKSGGAFDGVVFIIIVDSNLKVNYLCIFPYFFHLLILVEGKFCFPYFTRFFTENIYIRKVIILEHWAVKLRNPVMIIHNVSFES